MSSVMGRIADRLFWTEEGQARTDERFRQARDPENIQGQWRHVCIRTGLWLLSGACGVVAVSLNERRWTDSRIALLAFWGVWLVLVLFDFGWSYRHKRRGDWQPGSSAYATLTKPLRWRRRD
jgi:hypothetical protein